MIIQEIKTNLNGEIVASGNILFKKLGEEFEVSITINFKINQSNINKFVKEFNIMLKDGWSCTPAEVHKLGNGEFIVQGATVISTWERESISKQTKRLVEKWQI